MSVSPSLNAPLLCLLSPLRMVVGWVGGGVTQLWSGAPPPCASSPLPSLGEPLPLPACAPAPPGSVGEAAAATDHRHLEHGKQTDVQSYLAPNDFHLYLFNINL